MFLSLKLFDFLLEKMCLWSKAVRSVYWWLILLLKNETSTGRNKTKLIWNQTNAFFLSFLLMVYFMAIKSAFL